MRHCAHLAKLTVCALLRYRMKSQPVSPPPGIHQSFGQMALAADPATEEQMEVADRERKAEADKLMLEFLQARRQERANT